MNKPFFSIVIPSKDRADLIHDLIWSVLQQNFSDFEIIVCDNSSNNLTQDVISQFGDDRIVNIRTGNLKMFENWNIGINAVSGLYMMVVSDKGFLKQGALSYLYELIDVKKYKCITWSLDTFVVPNIFLMGSPNIYSREVQSSELIKIMLGADYLGFDDAPMHCTSCVSMETILKIKDKHKNVCNELNPDYTMAMQILLTVKSIYRINKNLIVLRRPSFDEGYGNGSSFLKKTKLSVDFLREHKEWVKKTNDYLEIPTQNNHFIIDIILKDVYAVLKDNKVNPEIYLSKHERLTSYYYFTYKEILWRKRMGINMSVESKEWFKAFNIENVETKEDVNKRKFFLRATAFKANIFYYAKTNLVTQYFLKIYRIFKYKNFGVIYVDIKDFYKNNEI